jgi:hypothetical protein
LLTLILCIWRGGITRVLELARRRNRRALEWPVSAFERISYGSLNPNCSKKVERLGRQKIKNVNILDRKKYVADC